MRERERESYLFQLRFVLQNKFLKLIKHYKIIKLIIHYIKKKNEIKIYGKIKQISIYKCKTTKIKNIFPPQNFSMPALKDIDGNINFLKYSCTIPSQNIYIINEGIFIPGEEEVYNAEGRVFREISSQKINPKIGTSNKKILNYKKLKGRILCLSLSGLEQNYYHFNIEYLARYYIFKLSKLNVDYIDFQIKNKFQEQLYKLLNISKKKIPTQFSNGAIKGDTLIVPSLINNFKKKIYKKNIFYLKQYLPYWTGEIHKQFRKKLKGTNRIYISRSSDDKRTIINEGEVVQLIAKYGFVKYDMNDLDINDQIKLFNQAEIVIAVHGAGITNIVFCSNLFKLLEIYPQNYLDSGYRVLSRVLKCDYHYLIGQNLNNDNHILEYEDVYVNCAKLKKWLDKNA